jgi:DNA-binding SARP family transcriptional activator
MVTICIIGTTRITDGARIEALDLGGVKPRHLVEMLALAHDRPVSKERLAEALWHGTPPPTYAATLESHVSVARRHLVLAGVPRGALRTVSNGYLLGDAVDVDVTGLRQALADAVASPSKLHLRRLGTLLPSSGIRLLSSSPYAAWAVEAVEELDRELAQGLRSVAASCTRSGDFEQATSFLERAQQAAPLSELTEQLLLQNFAARGARIDALVSFARFRSRIRDELGSEPGAETAALHLAHLRALVDHVDDLQDQEGVVLRQLLSQLPLRGEQARRPVAPTRKRSAALSPITQ